MKMIQVRIAHETVKVLHTRLRFRQKDNVLGRRAFLPAFLLCLFRAHGQFVQTECAEFFEQLEEDLPRCLRVVCCAVMLQQHDAQCVADGVQLVIDQIVHQIPREHQRVRIMV
ncbi:hypothetical protein SDC9_132620 [bioreactor metagenome]|uniref:Uncharacterized protein n=1 Tax=bioreactor metagenome TaxID=1076179 RepID=A0A645D8L5_9ZZZZ